MHDASVLPLLERQPKFNGRLIIMVQYEIALVLRAMSKQDLPKMLRGVCTTVLKENAIIRNLENLGERELPHKRRVHNEQFLQGR